MTDDILMGDLEKLEAKIDRLFQIAVSQLKQSDLNTTPSFCLPCGLKPQMVN